MTTQLRESFSSIGINETEEKILIYLIQNGSKKAAKIAQELSIKRPTAYSALEALSEHGLVTRKKVKGLYEFESAPKVSIPGLIERAAKKRFEETKRSAQTIAEYLSQLSSFDTLSKDIPVVVTLDTLSNFDRAVLSVLLHENFCAVWDPSTAFYRESWKADTEAFLEVTGEKKPFIREIIFECKEADWYQERIKNPNHKLLVLDRRESIAADMVVGEKSVIFSFNDPTADSGLQVFHKGFRTLQLSIFDFLWETFSRISPAKGLNFK